MLKMYNGVRAHLTPVTGREVEAEGREREGNPVVMSFMVAVVLFLRWFEV